MDSMDSFRERFNALEQRTNAMAAQTRTLARRLRWSRGLACRLVGLGVLSWALPVVTADDAKKGLEQRVAALAQLLKHVRRDGDEVIIEGANLHIRNGKGNTDTLNGLGNLIVGYQELRGDGTDTRTGSHNMVVGRKRSFSQYGGLMAGDQNTMTAAFASVSGGRFNTVSGSLASICGGSDHIASGELATISGLILQAPSGHPYLEVSKIWPATPGPP